MELDRGLYQVRRGLNKGMGLSNFNQEIWNIGNPQLIKYIFFLSDFLKNK